MMSNSQFGAIIFLLLAIISAVAAPSYHIVMLACLASAVVSLVVNFVESTKQLQRQRNIGGYVKERTLE